MGGGSSRYDETNWSTATGTLLSAADTIDGSPPTSKAGVYTITKQGMNQRDYDITDEECNLIYTTQCIEGTLAWFDVLGKGFDNYILRVQVDLSRRYWVIYRYGVPTYAGQFADLYATMKLREARGDRAPCLYKNACITVSWSRFYAIVHKYGMPPDDEDHEANDSMSETTSSHSLAGMEESKIKIFQIEMEKSNQVQRSLEAIMVAQSETNNKTDQNSGSLQILNGTTALEATHNDNEIDNKLEDISDGKSSVDTRTDAAERSIGVFHTEAWSSKGKISKFDSDEIIQTTDSIDEAAKKAHVLVMKRWKNWAKKSAGMDQPPPNPLEGYLWIQEPILKCEEVNSFMGQHQTMLISSEEARQLEAVDHPSETGADAPHSDGGEQSHGLNSIQHEVKEVPAEFEAYKAAFPRMKKLGNWLKAKSVKVVEASQKSFTPALPKKTKLHADGQHFDDDDDDSVRLKKALDVFERASANDSGEEKKESNDDLQEVERESDKENKIFDEDVVPIFNPTSDSVHVASKHYPNCEAGVEEFNDTFPDLDAADDTTSIQAEPLKKSSCPTVLNKTSLEPLVGYWIWDNTMQVHKMKMTVAKDSDLALHVVLAIVTNQLRLERNVILTTV